MFRFPLLLCLLSLLLLSSAAAQSDKDRLRYQAEHRKLRIEAGQRHLELGLWCRDRGLVAQGTAEFLAAVEVSNRMHPSANSVLSAMRRFEDAFWKKKPRKPAKSVLASYEKKAVKLRAADDKALLGLANWAWKRKLEKEAWPLYEEVVAASKTTMSFDAKGHLQLAAGSVPEAVSRRFFERTKEVQGRRILKDWMLTHLDPELEIYEHETPPLLVRCTTSEQDARQWHALATALMEALFKATGARPPHRLAVLILPDRKHYDRFLDSARMPAWKTVTGFADAQTDTAVICADSLSESSVQGLLLHELTHLYSFGITRAVMPSWYAEGFAESYGGQGSFEWDGSQLVVGGKMASFRLQSIRAREQRLPLRDLLAADALSLFAQDRDLAHRFYVQSWAFLRFLRTIAEEDLRDDFLEWEHWCHGAALGAQAGRLRDLDRAPASRLFIEFFRDRLTGMEESFHAYLDQLTAAE